MELKVLAFSFKRRGPLQLAESNLLWLQTASPSVRTSWSGLVIDLLVIKDLKLLPHLEFFIESYASPTLKRLFRTVLKMENVTSIGEYIKLFPVKEGFNGSSIGQLSCKKEAAGKVRVFALVDV